MLALWERVGAKPTQNKLCSARYHWIPPILHLGAAEVKQKAGISAHSLKKYCGSVEYGHAVGAVGLPHARADTSPLCTCRVHSRCRTTIDIEYTILPICLPYCRTLHTTQRGRVFRLLHQSPRDHEYSPDPAIMRTHEDPTSVD